MFGFHKRWRISWLAEHTVSFSGRTMQLISPLLKENTTFLHYKIKKEMITVYSENHTKSINTLCGQNAELLIAKVGNICNYRWVSKG
jgi:hypothetical protein